MNSQSSFECFRGLLCGFVSDSDYEASSGRGSLMNHEIFWGVGGGKEAVVA